MWQVLSWFITYFFTDNTESLDSIISILFVTNYSENYGKELDHIFEIINLSS